MTVKEAMMKVCDDAATFPNGWNTTLAEVIRKAGGEYYERRQKKIWRLTIQEPEADEEYAVSEYRSLAKAKAAMEEDIRETIARLFDGIHADEHLERDGDRCAHIGSDVYWKITHETLWD